MPPPRRCSAALSGTTIGPPRPITRSLRPRMLVVIGRGAAGAVGVRFLDIDLHLFLSGRIVLVVIPVEGERILRWREKSGQIPACRAFVQALVRQIGVLRPRPNKVATKDLHDVGANID